MKKRFYGLGPWLTTGWGLWQNSWGRAGVNVIILLLLCPWHFWQISWAFVHCFTLVGSNLACKYWNRLEIQARDKCSILLVASVSDGETKYDIAFVSKKPFKSGLIFAVRLEPTGVLKSKLFVMPSDIRPDWEGLLGTNALLHSLLSITNTWYK